MNSKTNKFLMIVATLIAITSMLAACSAPTTATTVPTEAPVVEATAVEAPATEAPKTTFTIGVSNPFISSEYRTQMIAELEEVNKEYMDQGITTELVIESADTDVAGQFNNCRT